MTAQQLFEPFRLNPLGRKNRVAMSPMTRSFFASGCADADWAEKISEGRAADLSSINKKALATLS